MGLPESGPGSIARAGRRILAIMIDWFIALLISNFAFGGDSWATLAVFAVEQTLLVGTLGYSIGHRIMGIAVIRPGGGTPGPLAGLVRAVLLCLVIPAVIFDPDQRGLHDKAMNTLLVRR
nr:RDD family protein [Pseudarthrobacter sp. C4D7]